MITIGKFYFLRRAILRPFRGIYPIAVLSGLVINLVGARNMTIYSAIEQEYMFEISHMHIVDSLQAAGNLLEGILAKYRHNNLSYEDETNIRLFFNSAGTLEGLGTWAMGFVTP